MAGLTEETGEGARQVQLMGDLGREHAGIKVKLWLRWDAGLVLSREEGEVEAGLLAFMKKYRDRSDKMMAVGWGEAEREILKHH